MLVVASVVASHIKVLYLVDGVIVVGMVVEIVVVAVAGFEASH